jgi:hypothetical protein
MTGDKAYRGIMGACASAAILVGIAWLAISFGSKS